MRDLNRLDVLAYRWWANHLAGPRLARANLAGAATSGLQDSAPRSALLSLAARVDAVQPDDWRAPGLAQVFGPRGAIYVVPRSDIPVFTRGLLPRDPSRAEHLRAIARRAAAVLDDGPMRQRDLDAALPDVASNRELRWAACLGTLLPVWDATDTIIHPVAEPEMDVEEARLELARRFFRHLGPATIQDFRWWIAGETADARATVAALDEETTVVRVNGQAKLAFTATASHLSNETHPIDPDVVHLLPPDDTYISRGTRDALLPDPSRWQLLWPKAPPPGALVIGGEVVGTWRRRSRSVVIETWHQIANRHVDRAEEIAAGWPLGEDPVTVSWTVCS